MDSVHDQLAAELEKASLGNDSAGDGGGGSSTATAMANIAADSKLGKDELREYLEAVRGMNPAEREIWAQSLCNQDTFNAATVKLDHSMSLGGDPNAPFCLVLLNTVAMGPAALEDAVKRYANLTDLAGTGLEQSASVGGKLNLLYRKMRTQTEEREAEESAASNGNSNKKQPRTAETNAANKHRSAKLCSFVNILTTKSIFYDSPATPPKVTMQGVYDPAFERLNLIRDWEHYNSEKFGRILTLIDTERSKLGPDIVSVSAFSCYCSTMAEMDMYGTQIVDMLQRKVGEWQDNGAILSPEEPYRNVLKSSLRGRTSRSRSRSTKISSDDLYGVTTVPNAMYTDTLTNEIMRLPQVKNTIYVVYPTAPSMVEAVKLFIAREDWDAFAENVKVLERSFIANMLRRSYEREQPNRDKRLDFSDEAQLSDTMVQQSHDLQVSINAKSKEEQSEQTTTIEEV